MAQARGYAMARHRLPLVIIIIIIIIISVIIIIILTHLCRMGSST